MDTNIIDASGLVGERKIDVRRGSLDGTVSSEWYSRPDDQRFIDLASLQDFLQSRREASSHEIVETRDLRVKADIHNDPRRLSFIMPDGTEVIPNHWSFSQMCTRIGAPAGFIRDRLNVTAGPVVYECLQRSEAELVKVLRMDDEDKSRVELRAVTGPDYGRVWDAEVIDMVLRVLDDGTWKVPGQINWDTGTYDPNVPVTKRTTTLYASDRDCHIFLCRDQYPIEIGKLPDGSPDYLIPGIGLSNSEVGASSLKAYTLYFRGMCQNRNLWGVESKKEIFLRHTKGLPSRFVAEALPALSDFSQTSANAVAQKVIAAKSRRVGDDDGEVKDFIHKRLDVSRKLATDIFNTVFDMEQHPCRSIWDVVQGATALARDARHQDVRVEAERAAGKLMDLVSI
jgi:hypothetical protein